ncbi:MAG: hypothetical protein KatS3mg131_3540 [Candidatus Tectimicrobiota bacterium]|nr:MAG: hypothetical protein KatS3mg131_3540 [Candidatus Tectomicrobia bacterium]
MRAAQDLREGHVILIDGEPYRVLSVTLHSGTAQFAGIVRATPAPFAKRPANGNALVA